jgi:hypothetical protein
MNFSLHRFFILLALLLVLPFQIAWVIKPSLNILTDSYRHEERTNALKLREDKQTPESKAMVDRELHLLDVHLKNTATMWLVVFLVIDGIGIYYFWNRGVKGRSSPDTTLDSK